VIKRQFLNQVVWIVRIKMKTVFVGDKPSSKNLDKTIPFVGTPSHKTLMKWICKLDIKDYVLLNSDTEEDKLKLKLLKYSNYKYIALGNNAAKVLKQFSISHYKLPHPSPKNRALNNKNFVDEQLLKCNDYLKG